MARRGVWRALPDDPRTPLGWMLANETGRGLPPFAVGGLALAIAMLALAWGAWLFATLPLLLLHARPPRRARDVTPFVTEPAPGPAFACRIESLRDVDALGRGTLLGADDGVLTFVEGWMHYAGRRTEFALRRPDVREVARERDGALLGFGDGGALRIATPDVDRLGQALRVWDRTTEPPEGESLLPPRGVHPVALAKAWRDAFFTVALWVALFGVFTTAFNGWFWIFMIVNGKPASMFRSLQTVRRLAREEGLARAEGSRFSANERRGARGR